MEVTWQQLKSAGAAYDNKSAPQIPGQPQSEPQGFDFVAVGTQGIVALCEFLGQPQRFGEHWKTTPAEAEGLAKAIDGVLPDDFDVSPWGVLLISAGTFVAPRIIITKMQQATRKKHDSTRQSDDKPPAIEHKKPAKEKPAANAVSSRKQ